MLMKLFKNTIMKRLMSTALTMWMCLCAYAQSSKDTELKVHYTFETVASEVGGHEGTLHNGASLTSVAGLPVLALGASNGYFDMGASVGDVIATLNDFTISTNVYIPSTTALGKKPVPERIAPVRPWAYCIR